MLARTDQPDPMPPTRSFPSVRALLAGSALLFVLAVVGGAAAGYAAGRAAAPPARLPPLSAIATPGPDWIADLVVRVLPAVVTIESREGPFTIDGRPRGSVGTGFFFRPDGLILTNEHVLPQSGTVRVVLQNGTRLEAAIVGRDPWEDFAVLRATGGPFPTLELGDSDAVRLGEPVVAIGSPLNFRNTVTTGVVSGKDREFPKSVNSEAGQLSIPLRGMLQTDAAINSGNSGGPLLDSHGRVIGINTAVRGDAENIGFAIAMSGIRARLDELIESGTVAHGYLGVRYAVIDPEREEFRGTPYPNAAVVREVVGDSTARAAGLQSGDVIVGVNGRTFTDEHGLSEAVDAVKVGDPITFTVRRTGEQLELSATLQARPKVVGSA